MTGSPHPNCQAQPLRKQYHFRQSERGLLAWDVDRLVTLSASLPRIWVPLSSITELDETYWFDFGGLPTCKAVVDHARLITAATLSFPIILCKDGRVMDGMHRVAKAVMLGLPSIEAVQFKEAVEPDHVGVSPEDLPYS